ncbi:hypothetical protein ACEWY4_012934 [Coilia grayii]|uniref:Ribosomal protein L32 n=1 Tax=Coilia grayii TaxID=363190 RepID=A0ABD1JUU5_9TELE
MTHFLPESKVGVISPETHLHKMRAKWRKKRMRRLKLLKFLQVSSAQSVPKTANIGAPAAVVARRKNDIRDLAESTTGHHATL